MVSSSSATPPDLGTVVTLKPIIIKPTRIQATGCIKVGGVKGLCLGQRQGVAMWQKSHLWGDLVLTGSGKAGKTGCRLSPFPSPSSITSAGLLKAAIKTAFFQTLRQAQG